MGMVAAQRQGGGIRMMIPPCDTSRWQIFRFVCIRIRGHAGPLCVQVLNMAPGLKSDGVDEVLK